MGVPVVENDVWRRSYSEKNHKDKIQGCKYSRLEGPQNEESLGQALEAK